MEASLIENVPTPPRATVKSALKKRSASTLRQSDDTPQPAESSSNAEAAAASTAATAARKLAFAESQSDATWEAQQSLRANALKSIRQALGSDEAPQAQTLESSRNLMASAAVMLAEAQRQEEREAKKRRKDEKRKRKAGELGEGGGEGGGGEGEGEDRGQGEAVKKTKKDKKKKRESKGEETAEEKEERRARKEKRKAEKKAERKAERKAEKERRKTLPASIGEVKAKEKRRASAVEPVREPSPVLESPRSPAQETDSSPEKGRSDKRRRLSPDSPAVETQPPTLTTTESVLANYMAQAKSAEEDKLQQEAADRAARDLELLAEREAQEKAKEKKEKAKAARKAQKEPESLATLAAAISETSASAPAKTVPATKGVRKTRVPKAAATAEAGPSDPSTAAEAKKAETNRRETLRNARNERMAAQYSTPELRSQLKDEAALNDFLAGSWIEIPVLQKLEADGVITYKRGKFTEAEKAAVKEHLETFKRVQGISHDELQEIMVSKGRNERSKYPRFWSECAAVVPGRPVRYVKEAIVRIYHPQAHKGKWTAEEDKTLLQAYELNPGAWGPISEIVGRTITDCRDRWRGELRDGADRKKGAWSADEVEALTKAVGMAMSQLGADILDADVPWEAVTEIMGRTRSITQCRKKWHEGVAPKLRGAATKIDRRVMIETMRKLGYQSPKDVLWGDVANEMGVAKASAHSKWSSMVKIVWPEGTKGLEGLEMPEILDKIDAALEEREVIKAANQGKLPRVSRGKRVWVEDSDDDDYLVPHKNKDQPKEVEAANTDVQRNEQEKDNEKANEAAQVEETVGALDEDTRLEELALAAEEGEDSD